MPQGIAWLAGSPWFHSITFARGIGPRELAVRLGADPESAFPLASRREAERLLHDVNLCVARIGDIPGWSFALEYGDAKGVESWNLAKVSRDGCAAISLDPQPDHPPAQFLHALDGELVCEFEIGEESTRRGTDPNLLVPAMISERILLQDGGYPPDRTDRYALRLRKGLRAIERHFGLSVPTDAMEAEELPLAVVRGEADLSHLG